MAQQMANVTLPSGTVFEALTASAGDRVAAQWRLQKYEGTVQTAAPVYLPLASMTSKFSANRQYRVVDFDIKWPCYIVDDLTLKTSVTGVLSYKSTVGLPLAVSSSITSKCINDIVEMVRSDLIKQCFASGYAPT